MGLLNLSETNQIWMKIVFIVYCFNHAFKVQCTLLVQLNVGLSLNLLRTAGQWQTQAV